MAQRYRAVISPGLEELLARELRALRVKGVEIEHGGVSFRATRRGLYQVLQQSRLAGRIFWKLTSGVAREPSRLRQKLSRLAWGELFPIGARLHLRARLRSPLFQGTGALISSLRGAIESSLKGAGAPPFVFSDGGAPPPDAFDLLIHLEGRSYQLLLDVGGGRLDRRGWRDSGSAAPLRSTYAAAALAALAWRPDRPLLDPLCGSGTILIEAARLAASLPPRLKRYHPAALRLPSAERALWDALQAAPAAPPPSRNPMHPEQLHQAEKVQESAQPLLWGADRSPRAIESARRHLALAEVSDLVTLNMSEATSFTAPVGRTGEQLEGGLLLTNPPYGKRLPVRGLVEALLAHAVRVIPSWTIAMLLAQEPPPAPEGFKREELLSLRHGGVRVRLWSYQREK